jgi:hypothetical protein
MAGLRGSVRSGIAQLPNVLPTLRQTNSGLATIADNIAS